MAASIGGAVLREIGRRYAQRAAFAAVAAGAAGATYAASGNLPTASPDSSPTRVVPNSSTSAPASQQTPSRKRLRGDSRFPDLSPAKRAQPFRAKFAVSFKKYGRKRKWRRRSGRASAR